MPISNKDVLRLVFLPDVVLYWVLTLLIAGGSFGLFALVAYVVYRVQG